MDDPGELIFLGAEAEVRASAFQGLATVRKTRVAKAYRRPELDARIRRERTRAEAQALAEAGRAGVAVPRVLDVDVGAGALELERVPGDPLRVRLERTDPRAPTLCRAFGRAVGRLHTAGLTHGDLTTSNVIVRGDEPVLIDFGLAMKTRELEVRGVDLHLVERTFESTHPGHGEWLAAFLEGYRETFAEAEAVLGRVDDIKARARYA